MTPHAAECHDFAGSQCGSVKLCSRGVRDAAPYVVVINDNLVYIECKGIANIYCYACG